MTGEEEVGCEDGGEEVEVEAVEVVEEVEEVVEAEPCKYVPYKSYFGTSTYSSEK